MKMRDIVVATTNVNKVKRIQLLLKDLNYNVISLKETGINLENIEEPKETKSTPVEIAMEKAVYYSKFLPINTIVLSQDDTIQLEDISPEDNSGLHIKAPVIKEYGKFTDEYAAEYYKNLATKYGGSIPIKFKYGHAIALRIEDGREVTKILGAESKLEGRLVNKINKLETVPGYFFSSLMEINIDGKWIYYNELDNESVLKINYDLYSSILSLLRNI